MNLIRPRHPLPFATLLAGLLACPGQGWRYQTMPEPREAIRRDVVDSGLQRRCLGASALHRTLYHKAEPGQPLAVGKMIGTYSIAFIYSRTAVWSADPSPPGDLAPDVAAGHWSPVVNGTLVVPVGTRSPGNPMILDAEICRFCRNSPRPDTRINLEVWRDNGHLSFSFNPETYFSFQMIPTAADTAGMVGVWMIWDGDAISPTSGYFCAQRRPDD